MLGLSASLCVLHKKEGKMASFAVKRAGIPSFCKKWLTNMISCDKIKSVPCEEELKCRWRYSSVG